MQTIHIANATIHIGTELASPRIPGIEITGLPVVTAPPAAAGAAPVAFGQRWPGQGGILVATIPAMLGMPARHLIAGDDERELEWGGYNEEAAGAVSHVDGIANTRVLLDDSAIHPAATFCAEHKADSHEDFFLPARFDLLMAYFMSPGTFRKEGWYWTSTQDSRHCAFVQAFALGGSLWAAKDYEWRVRPFRQILVTA